MMVTTQILMKEHQVILDALNRIEEIIKDEESILSHFDHLHFYFDFITEYSDELHHKKEEEIYFEWISKNHDGLRDGPVACMLKEHEQLREIKRQAIESTKLFISTKDKNYLKQIIISMTKFISILRAHIDKEDAVLYKMAEELNSNIGGGDLEMLPKFTTVQSSLSEIAEKYSELT